MQPLTKRQREILDYLNDFIQQHGYAPSLEEVGKRFGLSSLATVHKHLTNLQQKGFIKRTWNRSRSVEVMPSRVVGRSIELPLLGYVAAGAPIEAVISNETIDVPESLAGKRDTYVLRVRGDSMIDEQIRDGDWVIVEDRKTAENGETVVALLSGSDVTLKKFYRENGQIRLQPANRHDSADRRPRASGAGAGRRHRRHAEVLKPSSVRALSSSGTRGRIWRSFAWRANRQLVSGGESRREAVFAVRASAQERRDVMAHIVHIDLNDFLVSVERKHDPSLNGRAVVIGGQPTGWGRVVAASREAAQRGVKPGMSLSVAASRCPSAIFLDGEFDRYLDASAAIDELLREPRLPVEWTSIDSVFIDASGRRECVRGGAAFGA